MYLQETLGVLPSLEIALPWWLAIVCFLPLLIGDKSTRRQGLLIQELPVVRDAAENAIHQAWIWHETQRRNQLVYGAYQPMHATVPPARF